MSRHGSATTPGNASTTSPSAARTRISSRSATTCGDGTPTGSGARGRSGCSARLSGGCGPAGTAAATCTASRSEEHTSELQSQFHLVCRLLLEKKKNNLKLNDTENKK